MDFNAKAVCDAAFEEQRRQTDAMYKSQMALRDAIMRDPTTPMETTEEVRVRLVAEKRMERRSTQLEVIWRACIELEAT